MKKKVFVLFLVIIIEFVSILGFGQKISYAKAISLIKNNPDTETTQIKEPSNLYAISACLMDANTGRVLFEKNGNEQRAMASTTKIMTLIVTLENANLGSIVTVSSNAARQPDVQLNINTGEQYCLKDLLYSLMLESHNDVAVAIAEHVAGSVEGFAGLMNQKAEELGLSNTHFVTPNGLDGQDENGIHSTTSIELAKIMRYCIMESPQKETFLEITRTPTYSFSDLEGKRTFTCNNHNAFLNMMSGALSGKTGFTSSAGYCYVGALERDGKTFVVALLGCGWPNNKTYKWSDTKTLMTYGIENFEYIDIFDKEKIFEPIEVINGQDKIVNIGFNMKENEKTLPFLLRKDETWKVEYKIPKTVTAPVQEHSKIGEVNYYLDDMLVMQYPIYVQNEVKEIDLLWCLKKVLEIYFIY